MYHIVDGAERFATFPITHGGFPSSAYVQWRHLVPPVGTVLVDHDMYRNMTQPYQRRVPNLTPQ